MILDKIENYLGNGGLFNPELMEHEKVRDLIMDCKEEIQKRDKQELELKKLNLELLKEKSIVDLLDQVARSFGYPSQGEWRVIVNRVNDVIKKRNEI